MESRNYELLYWLALVIVLSIGFQLSIKQTKLFDYVKGLTKTNWLKIVFFSIFLFLVISLLAKTFYLFFYKQNLFNTRSYWGAFIHTNFPSTAQYIKELDIAGFVGGLIGLGVGVYITAIVEEKEEADKTVLNNSIADLNEGLKLVNGVTTQINKTNQFVQHTVFQIQTATEEIRDSNRKIVTQFPDILDNAIRIVQNAKTDLYVMTYSAAFGRVYCYIQEQLQDFMKLKLRKKLREQMSNIEYGDAFWQMIDRTDKLFNEIIRFSQKETTRKLHYGTLSKTTDESQEYLAQFLNLVVKTEHQCRFYKKSDVNPIPVVEAGGKTILCVPNEGDNLDYNSSACSYIIEKSTQIHNEHIDRIHDIERLDPLKCEHFNLKDIPLQMFLSVSENSNIKNQNEMECLVIFANKYNLGSPDSMTGFVSTDPKIVNSFITMFTSVCRSQSEAVLL
jgi:hypothetical protein